MWTHLTSSLPKDTKPSSLRRRCSANFSKLPPKPTIVLPCNNGVKSRSLTDNHHQKPLSPSASSAADFEDRDRTTRINRRKRRGGRGIRKGRSRNTMALLSRPSEKENEELGLDDKSDPIGNLELPLRRELLLRRELHRSFDLNQILPSPLYSGNPGNFPFECRNGDQNKVGNRCLIKKDTSKKRPRSVGISISCGTKDDVIASSEIDLELRLSSPNARFLSTSRRIIQSENNLSHNLKPKQEGFDFGASKAAKAPPLVLMGCSICYIYVMVPENDPKCPKCERCNLIDAFRGSSRDKRSRN